MQPLGRPYLRRPRQYSFRAIGLSQRRIINQPGFQLAYQPNYYSGIQFLDVLLYHLLEISNGL